ncbi:MAG: response regulator [Pseudobutyrivibrio sp.]|nr:response regulator [Pseudobutyrivibrio sp.]
MQTVLIVDDSMFMRRIINDVVTKHGYQVVGEATCSDEAIRMYEELKPDLITMDITMTVDGKTIGRSSNGIVAIEEIKKINPKAKILVVSAMGQKPYVIEAVEKGAEDFVVKPFTEEKIVEALTNLGRDLPK